VCCNVLYVRSSDIGRVASLVSDVHSWLLLGFVVAQSGSPVARCYAHAGRARAINNVINTTNTNT
jgi:hypothetical protein